MVTVTPSEWAALTDETADALLLNNEIIEALCGGGEP